MQKQEFLNSLVEELEIESVNVKENTKFDSIEEYDSMAVLSIIAFVDENFGKQVEAEQIAKLVTVKDLMVLLNVE